MFIVEVLDIKCRCVSVHVFMLGDGSIEILDDLFENC